MNCQACNKNPATVHVTEIALPPGNAGVEGSPATGEVESGAQPTGPAANAPAGNAPAGNAPAGNAPAGNAPAGNAIEQRHLCEECAQRMKLPYAPVSNKGLAVWKLLKESARRARELSSLACPECGMTLAEFRSKGRLGCPRDYEVFHQHLEPLLSKIHNAVEHKGRLPGMDATRVEREKHLTALRAQLQAAIQEEAYESAARLRDQIQELESARVAGAPPSG